MNPLAFLSKILPGKGYTEKSFDKCIIIDRYKDIERLKRESLAAMLCEEVRAKKIVKVTISDPEKISYKHIKSKPYLEQILEMLDTKINYVDDQGNTSIKDIFEAFNKYAIIRLSDNEFLVVIR